MKTITTSKNILTENSELLQDYFKDISKYPIYSGDKQVELSRLAKQGDNIAREKLITSNLKFIITCAKQYTGQGVSLMDLIQCGTYGLILAIDNYDPDKGYKFLSFAVWYIRREILKAIYNTGRSIRYPITYISKITKVKKAYDNFVTKNQREPSEEELIDLTNLTQKQYNSVVLNKSYCQSLDTPISSEEENSTLKDVLPDTDSFDSDLRHDDIMNCLRCLNSREREVIINYYGLNGIEKPIKEIAKDLGIGDERVRQLRKSGIKKLKEKQGNILKSLL